MYYMTEVSGEKLTQFCGKTCFPMNFSCEHAYPCTQKKNSVKCIALL